MKVSAVNRLVFSMILICFFAVSSPMNLLIQVRADDLSDTSSIQSPTQADGEIFRFVTSENVSNKIDQILYQVFERMNYRITMDVTTMPNVQANNGEYDGLGVSLELSDEYENLVKVKEPVVDVRLNAYTRSDENIVISDVSDIGDFKFGIINNYNIIDYLQKHEKTDYILFKDYIELGNAVLDGEIDVALIMQTSGLEISLPSGVKLINTVTTEPSYIYVNKDYSYLVDEIEKNIRAVKSDDTYNNIIDGNIDNNEQYQVLHISSYYPEDVWDSRIQQNVLEELNQRDNVDYYNIPLYSNRFHTSYEQDKLAYSAVRTMFIHESPDIVLVSNYSALQFVTQNYDILFSGIPIVYCGVPYNTPIDDRIKDNIVGTKVDVSAEQTLDLALNIYPETKNVFVINSYSENGLGYTELIYNQLQKYMGDLSITFNNCNHVEHLLDEIAELSDDTIVLFGSYASAHYLDGKSVTRKEIQNEICSSVDAPIFSLFTCSNGEIGGKTMSANVIGTYAGKMVLEVLDNGIESVEDTSNYQACNTWTFDDEVIKNLNIDTKVLPNKYEHINGKIYLWESNPQAFRNLFVAGLLLMLFVIFAIIFATVNLRKNRRLTALQKDLHTSEELIKKDKEMIAAQTILSEVINNAAHLIYWKNCRTGKYEGVNKAFADFTGSAENIGKTDEELFDKDFADLVKKEDAIACSFNHPYKNVAKLQTANGSTVVYSSTKTVIYDERNKPLRLVGITEEITERYALEAKVKGALNRLDMALQISNAGTWEISVKDKSVSFDKGFANLFKVPFESPLLLSNFADYLDEIMLSQEGRKFIHYIRNFDASENIDFQNMRFDFTDGTYCYAKNTSEMIINEKGDCIGMYGMSWDVTQEISMAKDLEETMIKAQEASKAKSEFLSRMTHEIRTPLNAIIGMSKIAADVDEMNKINHCLDVINTSSKHLLSIVNDILDVSKIESGKLVLENCPFNLEKMLINVSNLVIDKIESKNQNFNVVFSENLCVNYVGDELRLSQVFMNLLSNAVKFTPDNGEITLSIKEITSDDEYCELLFEVADSGIGMTAEQISRLFNSFEQADKSTTRKYGGTGLGLAISKSIVEQMGGKIYVSSKPNVGSIFSVEVRLQKNCVGNSKKIFSEIKPNDIKILVVDNDQFVREQLSSIIKQFGIHADEAVDYRHAVGLLEDANSNKKPYDVVILDYDSDMKNVLQMIKNIADLIDKNTAIIMTSFVNWNEIQPEINEIGIHRYISKPLFSSSVFDAVIDVIGKRAAGVSEIAVSNKREEYDFSDVRILFAEDVNINVEIFCTLMESTKLQIDVAENGEIAVEKFKKNPTDYDAIIMDIQMPVMDGVEASRQIRNLDIPNAKEIPIIAMTANVLKEDVDLYLSVGMNDHLGKPIDEQLVKKKIFEYTNKHNK